MPFTFFTLRRLEPLARCAVLVLGLICLQGPAQASVVIDRTRVVYDAGRKEVQIRLFNQSSQAELVRVWIDRGDPNSEPGSEEVPFILSPATSRIESGRSQLLRLIYTAEQANTQRESMFWLNVLQVPRKSKEESVVQLALRTRIKIFVRPADLRGDPEEAARASAWQIARQPQGWWVSVRNPSKFHLSFAELRLQSGSTPSGEPLSGTVAPGEQASFLVAVAGDPAGPKPDRVTFKMIDDFGALKGHERPVQTP